MCVCVGVCGVWCVCALPGPLHEGHHTSSDFNDDQKGPAGQKTEPQKKEMLIQYTP